MPAGYIPISGLNNFTVIGTDDYVALVDSASLTTYRVPAQSFLDLVAISGSVISASHSSASLTAVSSSWAQASISASHSEFSKNALSSSLSATASLSFLLIGSHTGSTLGTSSWAGNSTFASHSNVATNCLASVSSSHSLNAGSSVSSSWAISSLSSSFARTASYATAASHSIMTATASYVIPVTSYGVKAYGAITFWADNSCVGAGSWTDPTIRASYNIASIAYNKSTLYNPANNRSWVPLHNQQYKVTFSTPLPSAAYVVCVTSGGEEGASEGIVWTVHPFTKTTESFFVTRAAGGTANNDSPYVESNWMEFAVIQ